MISDTQLIDMVGKDIGIYPFVERNIEGASIFVSTSRFAWSRNSKMSIVKDGKIVIPGKDVGIILTEEAITLNGKVSGLCLSRVVHTVEGLILPTTPIKPGWTGKLIVSLYNTNDQPIELQIGQKIAVVMFSMLEVKAINEDLRRSRSDILTYIGIKTEGEEGQELKEELNKPEYTNGDILIREMMKEEGYKEFKKRKKSWYKRLSPAFILSSLAFIALVITFIIKSHAQYDTNLIAALSPLALTIAINTNPFVWPRR